VASTGATRAADGVRGPGRWLPAFAVAAFALGVAGIVAIAGDTLGYDFRAYVSAADRVLAGEPLYDPGVSVAGGFAIYLYPPPFAIAMLPFALLPDPIGLAAWLVLLVGAFLAGVALLPVRLELLRRVSTPVTTPHNFTPGAIAFQLGVPEAVAGGVQLAAMAGALAATGVAWVRLDHEASLAVTVVASQVLSPLLWDHYAMLLLIPTALLLERRHRWAVLIPIAGWLPAPAYPVTFAIALLAPFLPSRSERRPAADLGPPR